MGVKLSSLKQMKILIGNEKEELGFHFLVVFGVFCFKGAFRKKKNKTNIAYSIPF